MRRIGWMLLLVMIWAAAGCGRPVTAPPAEEAPVSQHVPPDQPDPVPAPPVVVQPPSDTPEPAGPIITTDDYLPAWSDTAKPAEPARVPVKGIYLTQYTVASRPAFEALIGLVERTELNAMVINVKDDEGYITFEVDDPVAVATGAVTNTLGDVKALLADLHSRNIYTIARIVTFKDRWAADAFPDMAVHSTAGGLWRDGNGIPWLNPYHQDAWEYNVRIAREAARAGFKEIQFDYVRFPTDGNMALVHYPNRDERLPEQVIGDFLAYARKSLKRYGVWVSADVFGLVTSVSDDMGIGQKLEEVARGVDYISPMVYPSHYTPGNLGVANPNAMPYDTVYRSMLDAKARLEPFPDVTIRPWLQDFSWGHPYGPAEVRAQIQAVYDAGYAEWILWNAANAYTSCALEPIHTTCQ